MILSYLLEKMYIPMNLSSLSLSSTLGDVFIHAFYLLRKKYVLSLQSELQMRSLITGCHIGGPHGVSIQNSIKLRETLREITQKRWTAQT